MRGRETSGVVAAGHPKTVETATALLEAGGNAVDAAVGAAFTSLVAEPMLTDVGGGGYMLTAMGESAHVYDFFVRAPGQSIGSATPAGLDFREIEIDFRGTTQRFHVGLGAAAVPGNISGLCTAHAREGKLPLSVVMEPSLQLARDGIVVTPELAFILEVIGPIFLLDPLLRNVVTRNGSFLQAGDYLDYGHVLPVLESVSRHGAESFYRGEIAEAIVAHCATNGGLITAEDLRRYETRVSTPMRRKIGGETLLLCPPPSTGGGLIAFMLELCAPLIERTGADGDDTLLQGLAMEVCNQARALWVDPLMETDFKVDPLADPRHIHHYRRELETLFNDPSRGVRTVTEPPARGNTTHISVMDGEGNCAAITSSNGEGSGCIVPGTGIHLNNMLGEEDLNPRGFHRNPPGQSLPSMMSPMVILGDDGSRAVLGSGGSNRIRSALFQTAYRLLFKGESIRDSILRPRMHVEGGFVQAESGVSTQGLEALEKRGLEINQWKTTNLYFGGVHGVMRGQNGEMTGHGDPRRGGCFGRAGSSTNREA